MEGLSTEESHCLLKNGQMLVGDNKGDTQRHDFNREIGNETSSMTIEKPKISENVSTRVRRSHAGLCLRDFVAAEIDDFTSLSFWQACLAEFVGTFVLCVYTIGMGLYMPGTEPPTLLHLALGTGVFIAVLVTSLAAVSGCHINPAVTLGFAVLRYISVSRAVAFIIFQCAGAVSGSMALKVMIHPDLVGTLGVILPAKGITDVQALVMEFLITAFLLFAVMSMVDKGRTDIQGSIPLIVGLTVAANILLGGPTSGAAMNPARALGPAVVMGNYRKQWIYWVGPSCGGVAAALFYDRLFSSGASLTSMLDCYCSRGAEYKAVVKKEAAKLNNDMELETTIA
nr:aquaporin-4 [Peronia verruculata]